MSLLDVINSVQLADNAITNQNRDMQYDLDRRVDRINRNTQAAVMDWDTFNQTNKPEQEKSPLSQALKLSIPFALIGAIVGAVILGSGGLPGALIMGAVGGLMGAMIGVIDDQKPEIRKKQLQKYSQYLDDFEKSHALARAQDVQVGTAEETTKWRDHAELAKQAEHHAGRA